MVPDSLKVFHTEGVDAGDLLETFQPSSQGANGCHLWCPASSLFPCQGWPVTGQVAAGRGIGNNVLVELLLLPPFVIKGSSQVALNASEQRNATQVLEHFVQITLQLPRRPVFQGKPVIWVSEEEGASRVTRQGQG